MKNIRLLILTVLFSLLVSCSKDDANYTTYPSPSWAISSIETLPNSFTAIVSIPEDIATYATESDKVAAFIGTECRGVGNLVVSSDGEKAVYYVTVRGSSTENQSITFKYYNSDLLYLYQSNNEVFYQIDENYGTYDTPMELDLVQL